MACGTVLVVDDDKKTVATIQLYLENAGFKVSAAYDGRHALEQALADPPDLIVLDLMLPKMGGMDLCRRLRGESAVPIIMLTARSTVQDKLEGLGLGADDYVTKPFSPRELVARVQTVLRRIAPRPEARLPRLLFDDLTIDTTRHRVEIAGQPVSLTPAEFKLLTTLAAAPSRVFSRQELVEKAFGHDYDGLDRTIDAHIMNLRKKIEPDRVRPSRIVTVYGAGYMFSTERDRPEHRDDA